MPSSVLTDPLIMDSFNQSTLSSSLSTPGSGRTPWSSLSNGIYTLSPSPIKCYCRTPPLCRLSPPTPLQWVLVFEYPLNVLLISSFPCWAPSHPKRRAETPSQRGQRREPATPSPWPLPLSWTGRAARWATRWTVARLRTGPRPGAMRGRSDLVQPSPCDSVLPQYEWSILISMI
jgi:hypothetical protein